jgi:hypothetical protein
MGPGQYVHPNEISIFRDIVFTQDAPESAGRAPPQDIAAGTLILTHPGFCGSPEALKPEPMTIGDHSY